MPLAVIGDRGVFLLPARCGRSHDTSVSRRFVYDGGQIAAEVNNPSGAVTRRYVFGPGADEVVLWYEGAGTGDRRWLVADERGSVVAVTNGSGAVTTINSYDDYGIPASSNAGLFQYTGQAWLPEVGLSYYKARMYSPTLGRFMQTDPIGYADGINWYNYVGGDPVNFVDPSGLLCKDGSPGSSDEECKGHRGVADILIEGRRGPPEPPHGANSQIPPGSVQSPSTPRDGEPPIEVVARKRAPQRVRYAGLRRSVPCSNLLNDRGQYLLRRLADPLLLAPGERDQSVRSAIF